MDGVEAESKPGRYPNLDDIVVEDDEPTLLLPCIVCNKTFKPEVLQRHSKVCEKNVTKKRKTFDSFKQRVQGTDLAEFLPYTTHQKKIPQVSEKPQSPTKTSSRWKENHEAFVSAIRAARAEGPDASGGSGDSRSLLRPPDHEQCPYCERHFGRKAFDRHQEWCREQHSRHPPVIASSQAKERLEARIKYRAPPIKSKRALTREKYSPLVQRKVRQVSPSSNSNFSNSTTGSATSSAGSTRHSAQSQLDQSNRLSKSGNLLAGRSQGKEPPSALGFNRGMAGRTSLRASQRTVQRPTSPSKRSPASGKLSSSPSQRLSLDESRGGINDREDMTMSASSLKKIQTRNSTGKQPETKLLDSLKLQKKNVPASNLQPMQIEINSRESKENVNNSKSLKENTNSSKSSKNDQLWRQGCHAKHTPFCLSPLNPPSPASSSAVTPRSLSKEREDNKKCSFRAKTNSVDVKNLVTELIVTQCVSQYARRGATKRLESSSQSCTKNGVVRDTGLNSRPSDRDEVYVSSMGSNEVPVIDTDSALSFRFSSSTEASSSRSADSNRTYITQSSVCCKTDYQQDAKYNGVERTNSDAIVKSSRKTISTSEEQMQKRNNSSGYFANICAVPELFPVSQQNRQIFKRSLKRATCQEIVHECSETNIREKLIPRKRVKVNFSVTKRKNIRTEKDPSEMVSLACPIHPHHAPQSFVQEDSLCSSPSDNSDSINIHSSKSDLSATCKISNDSGSSTTWHDVAKKSNHTSHYISFNIHSNLAGINRCIPSEMSEQSYYNSDETMEKEFKAGRQNLLKVRCATEELLKKSRSKSSRGAFRKLKNTKCGFPAYLQSQILDSSTECDGEYEEEVVSVLDTRLLHSGCEILNKSEYSHPIRKAENRTEHQEKGFSEENVTSLLPVLNFPILRNSHPKHANFDFKGYSNPFRLNANTAPIHSGRKTLSIKLQPLSNPFKTGTSGTCQEEPYDPYASAERQMMELLRSDSACNINKKQNHKPPSPAPSLSPMPSPALSPKSSPLETSPTSAFTRYAKEFEPENQVKLDTISKPLVLETDEKSSKNENGTVSVRPKAAVDVSEKAILNPRNAQLRQSPSGSNSKDSVLQATHAAPQPPPRSNKRLASLTQSQNLDDLVVSGVSAARPQLQSSHSLDLMVKELNSTAHHDLSNRPKTYDVDSHSQKESPDKRGWLNASEEPLSGESEMPFLGDLSGEAKVEVLNLDCIDHRKTRRETRESREVREITEQESDISDIDNLLEEVVRMQQSVSMLSEVDALNVAENSLLPANQSSARSRRNRTGKMHIEDFLFPAELLENNNFKTSNERSNSVFGSTKSRKSSSKGRRLIEDMLFPPGIDFNANSDDNKEDGDVVVSSNALSVVYSSPGEFNSKMDTLHSRYPSSPVALTSKAPNSNDSCDGLPRPKPMSLSTRSSRNSGNDGAEKESTSAPTSPMQPSHQGRQSNSSRLSADSAYSSLNRRSPIPQNRRLCPVGAQDVPQHGAESPQSILSQSMTQSLVLSSSGSESSLPPLSVSHSLKRGGRGKHDCDTPSSDIVSATTPLLPKLSKFCHQCGTKFLITVAKFCHECGAARLEIC